MNDSAKAMVQSVGVSGINQVQAGKEVRSHNPHNTLVYSETPFTPEIERAMNDTAAQLNKVLPAGFVTTLDTLSVVELSFSGNVLLKTMEGVGSFAGSALKAMFKKNLLTKLAAAVSYPVLSALKKRMDHRRYNGAALLGLGAAFDQ